jgi:hypothetical protein
MWGYAFLGIGLLGLIFTSTGKNIVKFGDVLFDTVKDRFYNKKKDIKIANVNDKNILTYEDIILITSKLSKVYDIVCFSSESTELNNNDVILNHNISLEDKNVLPIAYIKHGVYIGTVPFRPIDFNCKHLFIAIKNDSKPHHNVYKFSEKEYINMIDIIQRYEDDLKNNTRKIIFAEAFD